MFFIVPSLQFSVVGKFDFVPTHSDLSCLEAWGSVHLHQSKWISSFKSVKTTAANATKMDNLHANQSLRASGAGPSSSVAREHAVDESFQSLATRMKLMRTAKMVVNSSAGLDTFEVTTLLVSTAAKHTKSQRTLNEKHVQELMVRAFRRVPFYLSVIYC